jgi:hypothetical protein
MSLMHDWQVIGTAKMVSNDGTVILKGVKSSAKSFETVCYW